VRRGLASPEQARRFLDATERTDPTTLPGAPDATAAILGHVRRRSPIVVYGDYDVDGVCSTAILVRALRSLGAEPSWELPSRFDEGYGLSNAAVERLASRGVGLLVTVDCGITAVAEVAAARAVGIEVIVTDHHRPGPELPDCLVVHPALGDFAAPDLCASGVALKLADALCGGEADLDLAALATVCDLVPLRGENRRIVREGLTALARTSKPGLRALMAVAAVEPGELDERAIGFRLGPRLNAAGRMHRADAALELLLTDDGGRAEQIANELDDLNRDRREAETRILFAADAACAAQAGAAGLVVAGEGWHPGVVGIVASRLVERWHRPCVAIALADGTGRGSGRSISAYDLHAGLAACADHLRRFGGHRAAAGLELDRGKVDSFRGAFARHAGGALAPDDLMPVERVDAVVPGGALGLPLAEELQRLRPFGMGNPEPTLLVPAAGVDSVAGMGEGRQHARFTLVTGGARAAGVAFGATPGALSSSGGGPHDLAVRLELNRWNGAVEPRAVLRALCPTRPGTVRVVGEDKRFWERVERELEGEPALPGPAGAPEPAARRLPVEDRRGAGFAGVAGDLLSSGARVLVAVADVPRRRASLEALVAGLAPEDLAVASWDSLSADAGVAAAFDHLVALDPPPGGLASAPSAATLGARLHLAWGPAEAAFAVDVWRAGLELRHALTDAWRALGEPAEWAGPELRRALQGSGRYPRSAAVTGRLMRVLAELGLVEYRPLANGGPGCRLVKGRHSDLETSPSYRAYRAHLWAIERALAPEMDPPRRPGLPLPAGAHVTRAGVSL
jgi:single-stranded-DNA-specific exonuclease